MTSKSRQVSNEAYRNSAPTRVKLKSKILALLKESAHTDDHMEQLLDAPHQSVSSTRRHLVKDGLVEATGDLEVTRSGHRAQLWRLTESGKKLFHPWRKYPDVG